MSNELHIIEGLLIELEAEGFIFRLSARPHAEEGFHKEVWGVRLADGSWETKSAALVLDALAHRELVDPVLRVTTEATTSMSGRVRSGSIVGLVRLDLEAGVECIAEFLMGTGKTMDQFTRTAWERCCEIAEADQTAA